MALLVALPLRLYVALRAELISRDGAAFIWYAQDLQGDAVGEMRAQRQPPLYPAMVLASHHILEGLTGVVPGLPSDPVKSWILAAVAVTLAGGLAVVVGVYVLACVLFDARVGLIAALLAAVAAEFCQLSGDALTDMPHLAVFLLALAAAIRGVQDRHHRWLIVGGLLSGVAYLIRPEGAEVTVVAAAGTLLAARFGSLRRRMVGALLVCLAAGLVASPYMVITGKLVPKKSLKQLFWGQKDHQLTITGSLQLTDIDHDWNPRSVACRDDPVGVGFYVARFAGLTSQQGQVSPGLRPGLQICRPLRGLCLVGILPTTSSAGAELCRSAPRPIAAVNPSLPLGALIGASAGRQEAVLAGFSGKVLVDLGRAWAKIGENWARSLRVTLLLPAILWLAWPKRRPCEAVGGRLVVGLIVLHVVILTCLIVHFDYLRLFSLRHVMVLTALTLPFSAAGVAMVFEAVPAGRERLAMAALAVGLIGPTLPWMLETRYVDALHIRRAGEWIRQHGDQVPRIMTTRHRAALYANGVHVWCPDDLDPALVLAEARQQRPNWMLFEESRDPRESQAFFEGLEKLMSPGERLERVHETAGDGPKARRAVIFRYQPPR